MEDVCFYAHYDRNDKVADYVWHSLAELRQCAFDIVFVSTCALDQASQDRLRMCCVDVIVRENSGLDFGSWATAYGKYRDEIGGRLLLLNDSIYGPLFSLRTALADLTREPADFYGMVENLEIAPHLQSWFVLVENWIVRHPAFLETLTKPFGQMTKTDVIHEGEVGLTRRLVRAGFHYRALYRPGQSGRLARSVPFNPMHVLWREMIERYGIPFIKVELLRDNPADLDNLELVEPVVRSHSPDLWQMIEAHRRSGSAHRRSGEARSLLRVMKRRAVQRLIANDETLHQSGNRVLEEANYWAFNAVSLIPSSYRSLLSLRNRLSERVGRAVRRP